MDRQNRDQDVVRPWEKHPHPSLYDDVSDGEWYSIMGHVPRLGRKAPEVGDIVDLHAFDG